MQYPIPRPGQDASPLVDSAQYHADIIAMLNAYHRGDFNRVEPTLRPGRHIWITNNHSNMEAGEVLQIQSMNQPTEALAESFHRSPTMEASEAVWHSEIDNLVVLNNAVLANDTFTHHPTNWTSVKVTIEKNTDRYVMIDPEFPTQFKTSDVGIFKILGLDETNDRAIVDLTQSSDLWRFELTEEPNEHPETTMAKLMRMDGDEFASECEISDPTGMFDDVSAASGTIGQCRHSGNRFFVIDAECG